LRITSLRLLVPNGGEVWPTWSQQKIRWDTGGYEGPVHVGISRDGGATWSILGSYTPNDGLARWRIPGPGTGRAKIGVGVSSSDYAHCGDKSDGLFSLAEIRIRRPDGGVCLIGSVTPIRWFAVGIRGNVKIELWRRLTQAWETLTASTPNDGTEDWVVNGPSSGDCRIRISSVEYPEVQATGHKFAIQ